MHPEPAHLAARQLRPSRQWYASTQPDHARRRPASHLELPRRQSPRRDVRRFGRVHHGRHLGRPSSWCSRGGAATDRCLGQQVSESVENLRPAHDAAHRATLSRIHWHPLVASPSDPRYLQPKQYGHSLFFSTMTGREAVAQFRLACTLHVRFQAMLERTLEAIIAAIRGSLPPTHARLAYTTKQQHSSSRRWGCEMGAMRRICLVYRRDKSMRG